MKLKVEGFSFFLLRISWIYLLGPLYPVRTREEKKIQVQNFEVILASKVLVVVITLAFSIFYTEILI